MEFLVKNWFLIVAAAAVLAMAGYTVFVFVKRPRSEQIKSVKEWLLWAVTEAERELGSGTGQLKLRYVYNMFIERFDYLATVITFDMFSLLVDEALDKMKEMLGNNKMVKLYVEGPVENVKEE